MLDPTTKALLRWCADPRVNDCNDDDAADALQDARDAWVEAGCPDLEPEECPEGYREVPILIAVTEDDCDCALNDGPLALDNLRGQMGAVLGPIRFSTATIRAPLPEPVTDLGTVTAKGVAP